MLTRKAALEALANIKPLTADDFKDPAKLEKYAFDICGIKESLPAADPSTPTNYQLLGVSRDATTATIKDAYKAFSLKIHPDKNPAEQAERYFVVIKDAYEILSNEAHRKIYDLACPQEPAIDSATEESKGEEWGVNVSSISGSNSAAGTASLITTKYYSLYELFKEANLFNDEEKAVTLCQQSLDIALAALADNKIRTTLSDCTWDKIGLHHKEIAFEFIKLNVNKEKYLIMFSIEQFAQKYDDVCLFALEIKEITYQWSGKALQDCLTKHANSLLLPKISEIINNTPALKEKLDNYSKVLLASQDSTSISNTGIDFLNLGEADIRTICASPNEYFPQIWQYRTKIQPHLLDVILLGLELDKIDSQLITKISAEITVDDLLTFCRDQLSSWAALHPEICKQILINHARFEKFSGAKIDEFKKVLGDDQKSIDSLIMQNPILRKRYDAWMKFQSLASADPSALPADDIIACITTGNLSSADIAAYFYSASLEDKSFSGAYLFFKHSKLTSFVSEEDWIGLCSNSLPLCLAVLKSSFAEKISADTLTHWCQLHGEAVVLLATAGNAKLRSAIELRQALRQPSIKPQLGTRASSTVSVGENKSNNVVLFCLKQLRIIHSKKLITIPLFYAAIEDAVRDDLASETVTELQQQQFIQLISSLIKDSYSFSSINRTMRVLTPEAEEYMQIKQVFLGQLHGITADEEKYTTSEKERLNNLKKELEKVLATTSKQVQEGLYDMNPEQLVERLKQQPANANLASVSLKKAITLYKEAFSELGDSIRDRGLQEPLLAQIKQLLTPLSQSTGQVRDQAITYLMSIHWLRGEFKEAYNFGVQALPADKLLEEQKSDSSEKIMTANRLGFCLLQLDELYQQDKSLAEKYFQYAAAASSAESVENILALIGKASCLIKDNNVADGKAKTMLKEAYDTANQKTSDFTALSFKVLACSQTITMLQLQQLPTEQEKADIHVQLRLVSTLRNTEYATLAVPRSLLNPVISDYYSPQLNYINRMFKAMRSNDNGAEALNGALMTLKPRRSYRAANYRI